ncbi:MAG: hypothetical protein JXA38_07730 [Methanosarcinaceae archaeon]|nr:hypothetical protein [Methanosarcinaceae archaeon]
MSSAFDQGAQMVTDGIRNFAIGTGDDMYNVTGELTNTTVPGTNNLIMNVATAQYNPFHDQGVIDGALVSLGIYALLVLAFILIGGSYVLLSNATSTRRMIGQAPENRMSVSQFGIYCAILFVIPVFVGLAMWAPLIINYILSTLFMSSVVDSLAPSPDNIVMYLGMALVYMLIAFAFIWRTIVIGLSVKFAFIIFFLIVAPMTRRFGIMLFIYYLLMVFMQMIIVALTVSGISIIQYITVGLPSDILYYLVLGIFLLIVSFIMILGPVTIMRLIKLGGRLAVKL